MLSDIRIDQVSLTVRDTDPMVRFYTEKLGMDLLRNNGSTRVLGFGEDAPVLELIEDTSALRRPLHAPGLFHTAFLYPTRAALAKTVHRLAASGWPLQGAADHGVSEAIYLADPEGNGIEIYADRPKMNWPYKEGKLEMVTEALDIEDLLAQASPEDRSASHARIGHVHLQVSSLAAADAFWCGTVGLEATQRSYPGALFASAGGYHHHVGLNTWRSNGMELPEGTWTGLRAIRLSVGAPEEYSGIRSRVSDARGGHEDRIRTPFESTHIHIHTQSITL